MLRNLWVRSLTIYYVDGLSLGLGPQLGNLSYWGVTQRTRNWNHMDIILFTCLAHRSGASKLGLRWVCWPELLSESFPPGSGFLKVWWPEGNRTFYVMSPESKSKCSTEQSKGHMNLALKSHSVTSAISCWSKQLQTSSDKGGGGPPCNGMIVKKCIAMFSKQHLLVSKKLWFYLVPLSIYWFPINIHMFLFNWC